MHHNISASCGKALPISTATFLHILHVPRNPFFAFVCKYEAVTASPRQLSHYQVTTKTISHLDLHHSFLFWTVWQQPFQFPQSRMLKRARFRILCHFMRWMVLEELPSPASPSQESWNEGHPSEGNQALLVRNHRVISPNFYIYSLVFWVIEDIVYPVQLLRFCFSVALYQ